MSTVYGGPAAYGPPRRVNFGWIGESFSLFGQNVGVWIVAVLVMFILPMVVGGIVGGIYGANAALSGAHQTSPFGAPGPGFGGGNSPFGNTPGSPTFPVNSLTGSLPPLLSIAIQLVSAAWTIFMYGGFYRMAVRQVRGELIGFGDIFGGGQYFWRMAGLYIIYSLTVGIGTLLCIVPGLIASALLLPAFALVADGETVGGALSRASDGMKADLWNGVLLILLIFLLVLASAIPCGLGMFVTLPMFWLISALAYRDMVGMPQMGSPAGLYGTPPAGQTPGVWPPPPSATTPPQWGQTPGQAPPSWGQTPGQAPPRTTLGGDPLDNPPGPPPGEV